MTLDELVRFLDESGHSPCLEADSFSELDHALQCAWNLWLARPHDREFILAGLVHDVGHTLGSDEEHGTIGADVVRPLLGSRVADLVAAHVPAKRYLVATDPLYAQLLSPLSTASLDRQGGGMTVEDIQAWEQTPHFVDALELRRADDRAKVAGRDVPGLVRWLPMLEDQAALTLAQAKPSASS